MRSRNNHIINPPIDLPAGPGQYVKIISEQGPLFRKWYLNGLRRIARLKLSRGAHGLLLLIMADLQEGNHCTLVIPEYLEQLGCAERSFYDYFAELKENKIIVGPTIAIMLDPTIAFYGDERQRRVAVMEFDKRWHLQSIAEKPRRIKLKASQS